VLARFGGLRFGHRREELFGSFGQPIDLDRQGVDLIEQHAGDLGMVVIEASGERFDQGGPFGLHPTPRELG
jgi:hypothetical protein